MAGVMRKVGVYLGLMEDDDRYEYDDYEDEQEVRTTERREEHREEPPAPPPPVRGVPPVPEERRASVSPMPERRLASAPVVHSVVSEREPYRITTLHPRTYNEARTIGEHFREGTPVIMNLTEMDDGDAKRLVDFAAGLVFGLHGSIDRVTQRVFLLTPANIDVTAEDRARIVEGGFFNQS